MKYTIILVALLACIATVNATNCDRSWLLEKVFTLEDPKLQIMGAEPEFICTDPPQSVNILLAAVSDPAYENCETAEDLAIFLQEKNWTEDMIILKYHKKDGTTGSTIITTLLNEKGFWEVNNVNLPTRISGNKKKTELDAGFDPATEKITVIDELLAFEAKKFVATS